MTRQESLTIGDATIKVLVDDMPATSSARLQATHGEYPTYDETLYSAMLADTARNAGFSSALAALAPGRFDEPIAVEPGDEMDVTFAAVHESDHHGSSLRACDLHERLFPMSPSAGSAGLLGRS